MEAAEKSSLFKKIDSFVFKQVDLFKASPVYVKIQEPLNLIDDDLRLIINNVISSILILIPLIFIGILMLNNYRLKKEIALKKEIINLSNEILINKNEIQNVANSLLTNSSMDSDGAMSGRIKNLASSISLDPNKVNVSNFTAEPSFAKSNKIIATINFSKLSTNELTNLLNGLLEREKMRISGVSVRKNPNDTQLEGFFQVNINAPQNSFSGGEESE